MENKETLQDFRLKSMIYPMVRDGMTEFEAKKKIINPWTVAEFDESKEKCKELILDTYVD